MILNVTLTGAKDTVLALQQLPNTVADAIWRSVTRQTLKLQAHVVRDYLSGQVLNVITGALRRSIQSQVRREGPVTIGEVFSAGDVKYAGIHEFGFNGPETVRQHIRTVVFGKTVNPFSVGPFERHMNMPARPFMRPALADSEQSIYAAIRAETEAAVRQAIGK